MLLGCPRRFDPAAAPQLTASNTQVAGSFEGCRKLFDQTQLPQADACFARFVTLHAQEPLARSAQLFRARIALRRGDVKNATALLSPLLVPKTGPQVPAQNPNAKNPSAPAAPAAAATTAAGDAQLGRSAAYYLGLAEVRRGGHAKAIALLAPLAATIDKSAAPALAAALAEAYERVGKIGEAIAQLERLHAVTDRPVERLHARLALERLIDRRLDLSAVRQLLAKSPAGSLQRAFAARRLIDAARARGDLAAADVLANSAGDALRKHHLAPEAGKEASSRVGLLLPFSGRYRRVGALAFQGAAVAAGAFTHAAKPLELFVGDSGRSALSAARRLLEREHVVALVGVFEPRAASAVARLASRKHIPFLTLSPNAAAAPPWVLRALPVASARAHALAAHATQALGQPRVLVLAPESRYGTRSSAAFRRALAGRGTIVSVLRYPTRTTSFVALAKRVGSLAFDTLFVPDTARRLALLTPALAQAGHWSRLPGQSAPAGAKAHLLLATADGLDAHLLRSAGRYIQGAVLAPGYFPDGAARASGPLLRRYQRVLGHAPSPVEAFTHDTVLALRAALEAGARTPSGLLRILRQQTTQGLTGTPRFGANGARSDAPPLYRVSGSTISLIEKPAAEGLAKP